MEIPGGYPRYTAGIPIAYGTNHWHRASSEEFRSHTGDTTTPTIELKHIKNGRAIKEFLLQASDEARLKRRTINTIDIGADDMEEN